METIRRTTACELAPGTLVRVLNGDPDPVDGIVNGTPFVTWDAQSCQAFVPVHITGTDRNLIVHVGNIFDVREAVE